MKRANIVLGTLVILGVIATFAVLRWNSSSMTEKLQHGPVPGGVSQDEVARTGRAAEVLVTEEQVRLEKLAVSSEAAAEAPTIPAPTREQLFEAKHSGRSVVELIEARKGIEAELSQKSTQILKGMIQRGTAGSIISMASTHGMVALADRSTYGIAKAGIIHMTRMLAIEWAKHNITLNAIAPGTIETPSRAVTLKDPKFREMMLGRVPLGRFGTMDEIAAAAVYLASPEAKFMTGQTLVLDGGLTCY